VNAVPGTEWPWSQTPFACHSDPRWFHPSPAHEEALARLLFLVECQRRFGILLGESGTGKTLLMKVLLHELPSHRSAGRYVDCYGLEPAELLSELADALELPPMGELTLSQSFRRVHDALQALHLTRQRLVVCFDHLEHAADETLIALQRLIHTGTDRFRSVTFLVACQSRDVGRIAPLVEEHAELRVELPRLNLEETVWYVSDLLQKAGWSDRAFDLQAIEAIYAKSRGLPREINRLCELSLLAAVSDRRDRIGLDVVEAASAEVLRLCS